MTCDVSPVAMFCILIQAFVTCTYGVHTVGLVLVVSGNKIGDKLYLLIFLEQNITLQITQIILFSSQVLQMLFHQSPLDFCTVGWFDIY